MDGIQACDMEGRKQTNLQAGWVLQWVAVVCVCVHRYVCAHVRMYVSMYGCAFACVSMFMCVLIHMQLQMCVMEHVEARGQPLGKEKEGD